MTASNVVRFSGAAAAPIRQRAAYTMDELPPNVVRIHHVAYQPPPDARTPVSPEMETLRAMIRALDQRTEKGRPRRGFLFSRVMDELLYSDKGGSDACVRAVELLCAPLYQPEGR
jgi:hypothetical protein